jgi:hypothetical protein
MKEKELLYMKSDFSDLRWNKELQKLEEKFT